MNMQLMIDAWQNGDFILIDPMGCISSNEVSPKQHENNRNPKSGTQQNEPESSQQKITTTNLETKQVATQPDQELESKTVASNRDNKAENLAQDIKDAELTSSVSQIESQEVEEPREIQPITKIYNVITNKSTITIRASKCENNEVVECKLQITNESDRILNVYWIDYDSNRQLYGSINRFGNTYTSTSYVGHSWCLTDICNDEVILFQHICRKDEANNILVIDNESIGYDPSTSNDGSDIGHGYIFNAPWGKDRLNNLSKENFSIYNSAKPFDNFDSYDATIEDDCMSVLNDIPRIGPFDIGFKYNPMQKLIDHFNNDENKNKTFIDVEFNRTIPEETVDDVVENNFIWKRASEINVTIDEEMNYSKCARDEDDKPIECTLKFVNKLENNRKINIIWMDYDGKEQQHRLLNYDEIYENNSYIDNVWHIQEVDTNAVLYRYKCIEIENDDTNCNEVIIDDQLLNDCNQTQNKTMSENKNQSVVQLFDGTMDSNQDTQNISFEHFDQGQVGDCWLIAQLATSAQFRAGKLKNVLKNRSLNKFGFYIFELFVPFAQNKKEKMYIVLDDYFLMKDNPNIIDTKFLAFGDCIDDDRYKCIWSCLYEKLIAKLFASYKNISGDESQYHYCHVSYFLFGTETIVFDWNKDEKYKEMTKTFQLFGFIKKLFFQSKRCISFSAVSEQEDENPDDNIVNAHAYSLLDLKEFTINYDEQIKLLQIRNTWGKFEWNGKWSDNDEMWDKYPQIKQDCNVQADNDGIFWIEYQDFLQNFVECYHW